MGNAGSKVSPLRWIIAAIVVIIAGVLTALVVMVNVVQSTAMKEGRLPRIPFNNGYFLPDAAFISNLPMDAGMIVLVDKRTSYPQGCDVLIPDPNNHSEILVGKVEHSDEATVSLKLYNTTVDDITVQPSAILGKMDTGIIGVGFLYMAMLGFNGYIIFGLCPMLIGAILLVMMFKPGVLHRKSKVPDTTHMRDNGIEIIEVEVIPTTIPSEYCNEVAQAKPAVAATLGDSGEQVVQMNEATTMIMHDGAAAPAEPIGTISFPSLPSQEQPIEPIVPASVKPEVEPLPFQQPAEPLSFAQPEPVSEPTLSFAQPEPMGEPTLSFAQPEPPLTAPAVEPDALPVAEPVTQPDTAPATATEQAIEPEAEPEKAVGLDEVMRRAHELDFGDIPVEESKAKLRIEPLPGREAPPPLPSEMDADEILRLYRLSKHAEPMKTKASEEELLIMAKLYYEGNIDNYSSKE